jgi:predicted DNA-binding antitoxin AbrB/MazE fold protein
MHKIIDGIYENGKIKLKEKPVMKKARVEVKFLNEISELKLFKKVPDIFLNPVRVAHIKKISREELLER